MINYYNIITTIIMFVLVGITIKHGQKTANSHVSRKMMIPLVFFFLMLGCILRLANLVNLPAGLQQDEASIGYEAFILANYGIDRNGFPYPVYPITFGSGGGSPLMIYLNVLSTRLFGAGVKTLRLTTAIPGCLTMVAFVLIVREVLLSRNAEIDCPILAIASAVFALTPWHIMLSRWGLDSNTAPLWVLSGMLCFLVGMRKHQTRWYLLSAFLYALSLYSYGSANIIIPLHLIMIIVIALRRALLKPKQVVICGVVFVITVFPLLIFYLINYFGMPEVFTSAFTINRFTSNRLGNVFLPLNSGFPRMLIRNLLCILQNLTIGYEDFRLDNYFPGYAQIYRFTFPITLLGLFTATRRILRRQSYAEAVVLSLLLSAGVFALFIDISINRLVLFYPALIYCLVAGFIEVYQRFRMGFAIAGVLFLLGGASFVKDYFTRYNEIAVSYFMPGLGESILRADELRESLPKGEQDSCEIYTTYLNVSSPFMIALYYTQTNPYDYIDTLRYRDDDAEFRIATEFTHFKFGLPEEIIEGNWNPNDYEGDIFVVNTGEERYFDSSRCIYEEFKSFAVVYPH